MLMQPVRPIEFFVDWNDLSVIPESQDTTSAMIGINTRKEIAFSSITTTEGVTLDNYLVLDIQAEVYASEWHTTGYFSRHVSSSGAWGTQANEFGNKKLAIQTGNTDTCAAQYFGIGSGANSGGSKYCRLRIKAVRV